MAPQATSLPASADSTGAAPRAERPAIACGVVLTAAAVAAYSRTFSVPLLFDDIPAIADNTTLRHLGTVFWPRGGSTVSGRPVLNLSLALNHAISGTAVWSYHAVNLAIHVLAGLTLFGIVRRTLARQARPMSTPCAFCVALLWTLHPLLTESVTYIVQRAESLMGLFYLLTLYCFIRGSGARAPDRRPWYALSIAACLLGMGTKEVMASAPLVVLLYDRTFVAGNFREAWRLRGRVHAGLAATWAVLVLLVVAAQDRGGSVGFGTGVPWWSYALTQSGAVLRYLGLCFWPRPLIFDYGTSLAPPTFRILPDLLAVTGLLAATAWALVRKPVLGFLGACFFAILAPSSSVVPVVTETMAEHRMYLPLIPVVVLGVAVMHRWFGRAAFPCCLALAACLFVATAERNEAYRSVEGIWADTVAKRPENDRAHHNLGVALQSVPGKLNDAVVQFEEALRLKPDLPETRYILGSSLDLIPGRSTEAIAQYEEALRLKPDYAEAHYNLGCDLAKVPGGLDGAIAQFEEALRLKPGYPEAHYNLGFALDKVPGRLDEATAQYEEALRQKPDFTDAHYTLGCDLDQTPGRLDEAIAQFEDALRQRPAFAEAHYRLGLDLEKMPGRSGDAIAQFQETLRLKPDFAEAHYYLGNALFSRGRAAEAIAQYDDALRREPGIAMVHCNLGSALGSVGRTPEAIAQFEEALRLNPDYVEAHFNLGNALVSQRRLPEAIIQYEEALRLKPDVAAIHFNLALALIGTGGRRGDALEHLEEVVRLQPDNVQARQMLARLGAPRP